MPTLINTYQRCMALVAERDAAGTDLIRELAPEHGRRALDLLTELTDAVTRMFLPETTEAAATGLSDLAGFVIPADAGDPAVLVGAARLAHLHIDHLLDVAHGDRAPEPSDPAVTDG